MKELLSIIRAYQLTGVQPCTWTASLVKQGHSVEVLWDAICTLNDDNIERAALAQHMLRAAPRRSLPKIANLLEGTGIHPLSLALGSGNEGRGRRLARKLYPERKGLAPGISGRPGWQVPLDWTVGEGGSNELPENLKVPGFLMLLGPGTEAIPSGVEVGHLRCMPSTQTGLIKVADGLRVRGDMEINGQPYLESLGDGIHVGGDARISWCERLKWLGSGLKVGGDLSVSYSGIEELPPDLEIGGVLNLHHCVNLRAVPASVKAAKIILPLHLELAPFLSETESGDGGLIFEDLTYPNAPHANLSRFAIEALPTLVIDSPTGVLWRDFSGCNCCHPFTCEGVLLPLQLESTEAFRPDWSPGGILEALEHPREGTFDQLRDFRIVGHAHNDYRRLRMAFRLVRQCHFKEEPENEEGTWHRGWLIW